jgi:mannose-6-phosphate isomerase-like protein (cupin superfamily)
VVGLRSAYESENNIDDVRCFGGVGLGRAHRPGTARRARRARRAASRPAAVLLGAETKGGVFIPPNKPLTRLADLKKKHAGQANWKEMAVRDKELQAEYNSAAPGTKLSPRFHAGFSNIMVVFEGEMRWEIENQTPFVATRGSIVNIAPMTIYSYEVTGTKPAIWIDVNPAHVDTVYQNEPPAVAGAVPTKITFNRQPAKYVEPNMPHWNLFESAKAHPEAPGGVRVHTEHFYANANYGFADPNDPLNPNRGNPAGRGGRGAAPTGPFDPKVPFGHLHADSAEWWMVMVGQISGRFESGEVIGSEGDILYAPPFTWHQMGNRGPGPSCRLTFGAYDPVNFNNVPAQ